MGNGQNTCELDLEPHHHKVASSKATMGGRGKPPSIKGTQENSSQWLSSRWREVQCLRIWDHQPVVVWVWVSFWQWSQVFAPKAPCKANTNPPWEYWKQLPPLRSPLFPEMKISHMWAHNQMLPNTKGAMHHQQEPRGKEEKKKIRMRSSWTPDTGTGYKASMLKMFTEISRNGK